MLEKDAFCSYCGHAFAPGAAWPRTCDQCTKITFRNPTPVAVTLVPIEDGILTVRRGIDPQHGQLALPGGFVDWGESWQQACAREVVEETGILLDPAEISLFWVGSAASVLLVFGVAPRQSAEVLKLFSPEEHYETLELVVISAFQELAFPLHTEALAKYYKSL